jgi:hypothetical protein
MIGLFKAAVNKPIARSIHKFSQSSTAKWVPVNKSFVTLTKAILRAACERFDLTQVVITLRCVTHHDYRHLLLINDEQDLQLAAGLQSEEFIISAQDHVGTSGENFGADIALSLPIDFKSAQGASQRLGYLVAQHSLRSDGNHQSLRKDLESVAAEIVRTIARYQTRYRAIHIYGDHGFWIGNSRALRQLDQRMDQLAKGNLPVLVRADKGTGKVIAARSLHCLARPELAPFIESDCREWEQGNAANILRSLHSFANGGTLFLRNLEALAATDFLYLQEFWRRASPVEFDGGPSLKLVLSVSAGDTMLSPTHHQWLVQHTQELQLPGLDERRDDIRDLAQFFLREYAVAELLTFTDEAWALLESASWPGNVEQLKQLIKKLILITQGPRISADDLRPLL